jgi:hypothetical protein
MKRFFKALAALNKIFLPRLSGTDLNRLTKLQKAIVAYRYWVTKNAL